MFVARTWNRCEGGKGILKCLFPIRFVLNRSSTVSPAIHYAKQSYACIENIYAKWMRKSVIRCLIYCHRIAWAMEKYWKWLVTSPRETTPVCGVRAGTQIRSGANCSWVRAAWHFERFFGMFCTALRLQKWFSVSAGRSFCAPHCQTRESTSTMEAKAISVGLNDRQNAFSVAFQAEQRKKCRVSFSLPFHVITERRLVWNAGENANHKDFLRTLAGRSVAPSHDPLINLGGKLEI